MRMHCGQAFYFSLAGRFLNLGWAMGRGIGILYNPILGLYHKRIYYYNTVNKSVYTKEYKLIIERLKKGRIEAELAQQAVADKLGKPQSYISKIESGERRLDVAEIKKFAVIYKKDVSFFIK